MNRSFYLITIVFLIPNAVSLSANCEFKNDTWFNFDAAYFCYLRSVKVETPNVLVFEVHGNHLSGKTSDEVNSIWIDHSPECFYFPARFHHFFSNIKGLSITNTGLKAITREDLRNFPKLTTVWIYSNKLTTLGPRLFAFNTKLKFIDFGDNRIRSISADILDPIANLEKALFNKNICTGTDAMTPEALKNLEREILEKCQNGFPSESQPSNGNDQHFAEKLALLERNFALLQKEVDRLKAEVDGITTFSK